MVGSAFHLLAYLRLQGRQAISFPGPKNRTKNNFIIVLHSTIHISRTSRSTETAVSDLIRHSLQLLEEPPAGTHAVPALPGHHSIRLLQSWQRAALQARALFTKGSEEPPLCTPKTLLIVLL